MKGIRFHERTLVVGESESGKSTLLNWLASQFDCQILFLDTKGHEWLIAGVEPVFHPEEIDWQERVIHYVTISTELSEIEELFEVLNRRRNIIVVVHELNDLSGFNSNRTPEQVSRYIAHGGAKGRGLLAGNQLPVGMPIRARTEAKHVLLTVPAISDQHLAVICEVIGGISVDGLRAELEETERLHGPYSFMHFPKGAHQEPTRYPPLPAEFLAAALAEPLDPHPREGSARRAQLEEDDEELEEVEPE